MVDARKDIETTDRLLNPKELRLVLGGMAPSTMYRHISSEPGFPQPIKIGHLTRFRDSDLQQYIEKTVKRTGVEYEM